MKARKLQNVNLDLKSNENDLQMSRTESSASSNGFHISLFIDCPKTKKLNIVMIKYTLICSIKYILYDCFNGNKITITITMIVQGSLEVRLRCS